MLSEPLKVCVEGAKVLRLKERLDLFCGGVSLKTARTHCTHPTATILLMDPSFCLPNVLEAHHLELSNLECVMIQAVEHRAACVPIVIDTFNDAGFVRRLLAELDVEDD